MMRAPWRMGRRGAFLSLFGVIYILIGLSYLGNNPTGAVRVALALAIEICPLWVYGVLWVLAGSWGIVAALVPSPNRYGRAFGAEIAMPTLWAFVYFAAWLHGDTSRGWSTAAIFAAIAAAVGVVSGMVNPSELQDDQ